MKAYSHPGRLDPIHPFIFAFFLNINYKSMLAPFSNFFNNFFGYRIYLFKIKIFVKPKVYLFNGVKCINAFLGYNKQMIPKQTSLAEIHLKQVQNINQKKRRGFNVDKLLIKLDPEVFKPLKGQEIKPELFFRSKKEAEGEKKKITIQYLEWENIYVPYDKGPYSKKNQITFQFILQGKKEAAEYTTPFFNQTFIKNNEILFNTANRRCGDIKISISWKQNFKEGNQTPIQKPNRFSKQNYPSQSQQPSIFQTLCGFLSCNKQTEEQKNRKALKIKKTVMYDLKDFVTEEQHYWDSEQIKEYPLRNLIEFHSNKSILS